MSGTRGPAPPRRPGPAGAGPLAGVRVLDLADQSGALAGKLLAGLGADVVLAEPEGGSRLRAIPPFWRGAPDPERSLFFWFYAAGKRSVRATPEGLARLVAAADVLIDTGPPGAWQAWRERHPRLIVASITPFGQRGPYASWTGTDLVAQATGGMLAASGHAGGPPLCSLGLQAYHQAGVLAAAGALAALLAREVTGCGQHVDVSLQAAVAAALEHAPGLFHQDGRVLARQGALHWTRFFRLGRCRDGWVLLSSLGDWTSLREWLKADGAAPPALDDPAFDDPAVRQARAEEIFAILDAWAARQDAAALSERAQLLRLPWAAVRAPEALLGDPHLAARGFFVPIEHPDLPARLLHAGAPFRAGHLPWHVRRPPRLGEHDGAVDRDWAAEADVAPSRRAGGAGRTPPVGPLHGIRVLDFTWVVAGPVATRALADLGADVIKVERRDASDSGDRRGGLTGALMRGKRSIVLDLARPRGAELARRLAAACDVVVDSFSARVMPALGLDFASLRRLRPDLICVRMTGYGLAGPERDRVSYGPTLQALTGYTLLMAEPGGPPAGFGYSYADLAAGHMGALATLAALRHRQRTGEGMEVDLAQQEVLASLLGPLLLERAADGGASEPPGRRSQEAPAAPYGVYPCAGDDRWLAISVSDDRAWRAFVATIGEPAWACEPRFATHAARLANAAALDAQVAAWTRTQDAGAAMATLQAAGVAAGRVADARDLCARDPQLAARGYFVDVPTPEGGTVRLDGPPFVLSETPAAVQGPGPLLGEHTDAVLAELLGLGTPELAALRADGVVA